MLEKFEVTMLKMSLLGFDQSTLTDCSDVIPTSPALALKVPVLPAGTSMDDIEASCQETPFPTLDVAAGAQTSVAAV